MNTEWKTGNTLELPAMRAALKAKELACAAEGCENVAHDVHHLDHDHGNNTPGNLAPACKRCHNEVHGITAQMSDLKLLTRLFYSAQDQRKAAANRVRAYQALGIEIHYAEVALQDAEEFEAHLQKHIEALLKTLPFYGGWLKKVKGIGPLLAASLMSEIGSAERFDSVAALWSYAGLGVNGDGQAPRRSRGEKANWNAGLKMAAYKVAVQFVKVPDCLGRRLYDQYKAYYIQRDGPDPKWQVHARAMRRVEKDFLRCLWAAWRESLGLAVTEARVGTWPMPHEWVSNGEACGVLDWPQFESCAAAS